MKNEEIIQVLGSYLNSLKTSRRRCVEQKSYTELTEVVLVNLNREIQAVDEAVEILKRVPENEPLSLEQLRNMVGAPVWMEELEDEAAEHAAAFIKKHCDRLLFEHTDSMDTATVVKRLVAGEQEEKLV